MNDDSVLAYARRKAYRSSDPAWWAGLGAAYATCNPPDLKRARQWYRRAALRDDVRAQFEYGLMLINGEGGPRRPAAGRRRLERAAKAGDVDALKVLTHAYRHGAFSYQRSAVKARLTARALRAAQARLRRSLGS